LRKWGIALAVFFLIMALLIVSFNVPSSEHTPNKTTPSCYVGVSFCGNTSAEAKILIDRVKTYTNMFILQSGPVSTNETATNEICNYAVSAGLDIMVYFGDLSYQTLTENLMWRIDWVNSARSMWGDHLLGVYYYDEPGGIFLDTDKEAVGWPMPANYTYDLATQHFIQGFQSDKGVTLLKDNSIPLFVSDYALYWFDYLLGYDVVLTQIGWNHTLTQDIALLRGAANVQNKKWGAKITWKYDQPPYLDSGTEIYTQMATVYEAGAKYVAIFNYPQLDGNSYGVMQDEHFEALERFWNDIQSHKLTQNSVEVEAALVLPKNYGWGMRNPDDIIWGFWGADEKSPQIWQISRQLLSKYGLSLDIIYDDSDYPFVGKYNEVYLWNATLPP
jgi:hypothetical protein